MAEGERPAGLHSLGSGGVGNGLAPAAEAAPTGAKPAEHAKTEQRSAPAAEAEPAGAKPAEHAKTDSAAALAKPAEGAAPKPGRLMLDGKDVSEAYAPVSALQQRVGEANDGWRRRLREKGIDPETLEAAKPAEAPRPDAKAAEQTGTGLNDIWADPDPDKFDSRLEYDKAVMRTEAHNQVVRDRLAQQEQQEIAQQRVEAKQREQVRLTRYVTEELPTFLQERGIDKAEYDRVTLAGPEIGTQRQRLLVAGWVLEEATNMPAILYEVAQIPAAEQARLFNLSDEQLLAEMRRIDARLEVGLAWNGKSRAAAASQAAGQSAAAKGVDNRSGKADIPSTRAAGTAPPQVGGGATARQDGSNLTGKERLAWLEEQDKAARAAKLQRRQAQRA